MAGAESYHGGGGGGRPRRPRLILIEAMVGAFNEQLKSGVADKPRVQLADAFAFTQDHALNHERLEIAEAGRR